jgi:hypothetical protein
MTVHRPWPHWLRGNANYGGEGTPLVDRAGEVATSIQGAFPLLFTRREQYGRSDGKESKA